jgi:DNA-binding NarL/FixJ family response regulator
MKRDRIEHLRIEALEALRHDSQERGPVVIAVEDRLAPDAARRAVADGAGGFDPKRAADDGLIEAGVQGIELTQCLRATHSAATRATSSSRSSTRCANL